MNKSVKRMTNITMLLAIGILLHYIESLIPLPVPFPGIKLGFANIVGLITLYMFGFKTMLLVNLGRVLIASLLSGSIFNYTFAMALSGAIVSTLVIGILKKYTSFSIFLLSLFGSLTHVSAQIATNALMIQSNLIVYYLPILLICAIPTGLFTGYIGDEVLKRILKDYKKEN